MSAQQCDENEAAFRKREPVMLNAELQKRLDSALAAIPQLLRELLLGLANDYGEDEIEQVLAIAKDKWLYAGDGPPQDSSGTCFCRNDITIAWRFIHNYVAMQRLVGDLNQQAAQLLQPPVNSVATSESFDDQDHSEQKDWWTADDEEFPPEQERKKRQFFANIDTPSGVCVVSKGEEHEFEEILTWDEACHAAAALAEQEAYLWSKEGDRWIRIADDTECDDEEDDEEE